MLCKLTLVSIGIEWLCSDVALKERSDYHLGLTTSEA